MNSSGTLPSSSPSTSSSVIMPTTRLSVSTTSAWWLRRSRRNASRRSALRSAGTRCIGRTSAASVVTSRPSTKCVTTSLVCRMPTMSSSDPRTTGRRLKGLVAAMRSTSRPRRRDVHAGKAFARDHQLLRIPKPETQRTVQPHLLLRLEQPAVAAFGDQERNLLGRMDVPMARARDAEGPQDQIAAAVEDRDQPRVGPQRPLHGDDGVDQRLRRILQRDRLRHQLADDHGQHREHEEDDDRGHLHGGLGVDPAETDESRSGLRREDRLRVGAGHQARQRDADLRGRDVAVELAGVFEDREGPRRQQMPVFGHPAEPAAPGSHRREFSGDVEGREQNQQQDDSRRDQHAARSSSIAERR